jgi:DtxR family Mn-dependent transcriptional regulator
LFVKQLPVEVSAMAAGHAVSATVEDYLEAILNLEREKRVARVRDIAKALSVHKSTVSAALKSLADKSLINYSPYETTTLTPRGRRIAEEVSHSHGVIRRFLTDVLLVDEGVAEANACRMEHDVDKAVLDRLVLFARFLRRHPRAGRLWIEHLNASVETREAAGAGDGGGRGS